MIFDDVLTITNEKIASSLLSTKHLGKLMQKYLLLLATVALTLTACNNYNALLKTQDYEYKYEAAKQCYVAGHYTQCYQLLDEMLLILKGSDKAEESLFMDAMCHYNLKDYETATTYFDRYAKTYSKGDYTELS